MAAPRRNSTAPFVLFVHGSHAHYHVLLRPLEQMSGITTTYLSAGTPTSKVYSEVSGINYNNRMKASSEFLLRSILCYQDFPEV